MAAQVFDCSTRWLTVTADVLASQASSRLTDPITAPRGNRVSTDPLNVT